MKNVSILILVLFISIKSCCQSAIEIQFTIDPNDPEVEDRIKAYPAYNPKMLFNDSFALVYFSNEEDKQAGSVIGDKLIHHGTFYNFITNEKFWEIAWPRKEKYLVKDTTTYNWQFFTNEQTILGKVCHPALSILNHDSILVWYTNELVFKKGPLFYNQIPGVILEAYDHKRHQHIVATKITETSLQLVQPREGILLNAAEWEKARKNREWLFNQRRD